MSTNKSKVAMLIAPKTFEIQEYPIPEVSDDEILIKVEGCGVCGTDVHEYKSDPFGCLPIVLGHEGTGEIVKLGKNVTTDTIGKPIVVGDKLVTSIIPCGQCDACVNTPGKTELCENMGCYGLMPDDQVHLNGWFGEYLVIRKDSTFFNVSEFDVETRIMIEPIAVAVHAVERAKTTGLLNFGTPVLIQGCGPIGLAIALVLKTMGVQNVFAIDGNDSRLEFSKKLGVSKTFNFMKYEKTEDLITVIKKETNNKGVGFAFQTTGSGVAFSSVFKHIARGGGLCEVGFFVELGDTAVNPHQDICFKEITVVGSYAYTPQVYPVTLDCVRSALAIGLPINEFVTDWYPLDKINDAFQKNIAMEGIKIAVGSN
ncbi:zinc-dependent alcohol dehydrogenase [Pseudotamlana carrageenivorans]|uniref:Theronine dehydrogenase n=1 Tax=Pseudotamlana carrageenivorans TaxID=2069432 RepID=A0A2I7SK08_9FLAO|nr:zinc-binding dehydrogenase [Tamlana carrageenivorans]AUS06221.1 theronine dehydrogenase [Tamlana carrageenivorans]